METTGMILVHVTRSGLDDYLESRTYSWTGGRLAILSYHFIRGEGINPELADGKAFKLGHLRLRVVSYDFCSRSAIVSLDGSMARFLALLWPLRQWAAILRGRVILTAAVWGFARTRREIEPSLHDLCIVQTVNSFYRRWSHLIRRLSE